MTTGGHGIRPLLTTPGKFGYGGRQRQSKHFARNTHSNKHDQIIITYYYRVLPNHDYTHTKQYGVFYLCYFDKSPAPVLFDVQVEPLGLDLKHF
jgi:hypothetical protein